MFGIQLSQMLQREGWAGAVAQQALQPCPICATDTHRGVQREAAAVFPSAHHVSVVLADLAATDEGSENAPQHQRLQHRQARLHQARTPHERPHLPFRWLRVEYPINDAAVEVDVLVQGRTEAVDEGHRTKTGRSAATGAVFAQAPFHPAQKDAQHGALQGSIGLQKVAQPLGHGEHGEHPLAYRNRYCGQLQIVHNKRSCTNVYYER